MSNYYDRIAHLYDATRPLPQSVSEKIADCILQIVRATPEMTFLEPGIGTGRTGLPIIQKGYSYTGIDISKQMMDELRRKLQGTPKNLTLIHADASSLPFEDNSFDVVLTTHMLHCLPNWLEGLSEIRRVLKPSGFYLSCENLQTLHQKEFESQLRGILAKYQSENKNPTQAQKRIQPSPFGEGMTQVLTEQGATVETITAARWRVEQTVRKLFDIYYSRAIGVCWDLPEQVFFNAMQEFREWLQQHYESFEFVLSSDATFDITVARHWVSD